MDKLKLHTPDLTAENIEKIAAMFPNCVTEARGEDGTLTWAVDFDQLRQELSTSIAEGPIERYHLDWPGKREALLAANAPIAKTLRPCRQESVEFDTTRNLFIEGDNLDALKLLQETYLNKVKFIYIDPPYNTGNDFLYDDDFTGDTKAYLRRSNVHDDACNRMVANPETNGRFHSDWLTMTYPRLKLARTLLREDGVLFMNIGEEELSNSDKLLSYVFGEQNRVSIIARVVKTASNLGTHFAPSIDFLLCYARNFSSLPPFKDKVDETLYKKVEASGPRQGERYRDDVAFYQASQRDLRPNQKYPVECPDGSWAIPPCSIIDETMREGDGRWRWSKQTYYENKHLIVFKETKTSPLLDANGKQSRYNVYTKSYLKDRAEDGTTPRNLMTEFINRKGADLIKKFGIAFDFSKPVELMQYLQEITGVSDDDIVLDFYAGSCSTAHAVMNLNAVDAGHRRHIMVQLSEPCDDSSEAFKSGLRTIAEIGKERIRRTGAKIKEQSAITAPDLDVGFRVLKVDSSNMKDVYYAPDAITQADLLAHFDNIREDRTAEDLLFQVLVDWGVDLALPIAAESLAGKTVFFVDSNALAACFDADITEDLVKELAKRKPLRAVFRDSSYGSDSVKINVEQIFKLLSPGTEIKSL